MRDERQEKATQAEKDRTLRAPFKGMATDEIERSIRALRDQQLTTDDAAELTDIYDMQDVMLYELKCRAQEPGGAENLKSETCRMLIIRCTDRELHPSRQLETIHESVLGNDVVFTAGDRQRFTERERPDNQPAKSPDYSGSKALRLICPSCKRDRPLGQETLRKLFEGLAAAGKFETRRFVSVDVSKLPGTFR